MATSASIGGPYYPANIPAPIDPTDIMRAVILHLLRTGVIQVTEALLKQEPAEYWKQEYAKAAIQGKLNRLTDDGQQA